MKFQHHEIAEVQHMVDFVHAEALPALLKEMTPIYRIHFEQTDGACVLSVYHRRRGPASIMVSRSPTGLLKYLERGKPNPDADIMRWDFAEARKPLEDEMADRLNAQCLDHFGADHYFQTVSSYRLDLDEGIRRMARSALASVTQESNYPLPQEILRVMRSRIDPNERAQRLIHHYFVDDAVSERHKAIFGTEPLTASGVNYVVNNGRALDSAERECPGSVMFRYCCVDRSRSPVSTDSILDSVEESLPDEELKQGLPSAMLNLVERRKARVMGHGLRQQVEAYCRMFRDCRRAGLSLEAAEQALGVYPTVSHHFCDLGDDAWTALRDMLVLYGQQDTGGRNRSHLELMMVLNNLESLCRKGRVPNIAKTATTWHDVHPLT